MKKLDYKMTGDVLNGMTLESAAEKHGYASKQSAQYTFRLTVVKFFLPSERSEIEKNNHDLRWLRKRYKETQNEYFKL